jgi:hypothetical protein
MFYYYILKGLKESATPNEKHCLKEAELSGAWLTVAPSVCHNTILLRQEFVCVANLWYGFTPQNLPTICNGCGKAFSINHMQECKLGASSTSATLNSRMLLLSLLAKPRAPLQSMTNP